MAITAHFLLVSIHSRQLKPLEKKSEFYARAYVYPFFHQSWNLFVPAPNTNYKLFVHYENNGQQKTDLFNEILVQHQSNRFRAGETFVTTFANSIHYFEKSISTTEVLNGPISNNLNFSILEHAAKNYLEYSRKIKIEKLKLILCVQNVLTQKQTIFFN